jgi:hypothetical protein
LSTSLEIEYKKNFVFESLFWLSYYLNNFLSKGFSNIIKEFNLRY